MAAQTVDAWAETRKIHKEFSGFYKIAGGLVLVLIGILIGAGLFHNDEGYWGNILSEVLGIGFAVFVLDQRAEQRAERRQIKELQEQLIMEARSQSNEAAKRAVAELRGRGWLEGDDGLLRGETLNDANLKDAKLFDANLQAAILEYANLQNVDFWNARLQGAFLRRANLQGARFQGNEFDENTTLPDGSKWSPDTDLTRFIDPNHPQFWRSGHPGSPAYRGKSSDQPTTKNE